MNAISRLAWFISDTSGWLWCCIVGHNVESVRRLLKDPNSTEAREFAASYFGAFGTSHYCRRCGKPQEKP